MQASKKRVVESEEQEQHKQKKRGEVRPDLERKGRERFPHEQEQ